MWDNLRADTRRLREIKTKPAPWYVLESLLFENGYQAVVLHRLAHWFKARGIPFFGPAIARYNLFLTGVDIAPAARIGPGLRIAHGTGVVVGNAVEIGSGCLLMHGVTLGAPTLSRIGDMPKLGDRVTVGAQASVIGPVAVGDDSFIGAHVLVTRDVPSGSKVTAPTDLEIRPRGGSPSVSA